MSEHPDAPHSSGDDRCAIYSVTVTPRASKRIAETSLEHVSGTIISLRDEGQLSPRSRVGVFDRLTRTWLIDPWANGDPETT